jgi:AcrR family transcriptional regulator
MPNNTSRPRKIPRQARSLATVEVILDATALLLVNEGYAQTTTNRVADRAGVSIGSLYQYFPNREALVTALTGRTEARITEALWQTISTQRGPDLRSVVGSAVHATVSTYADALPLCRALFEVAWRPMPAQARGCGDPRWHAHLVDTLRTHAGELRSDFDVEASSFFMRQMACSAILGAIVSRPSSFTNGELERELNMMLSYYMTGGNWALREGI